jgi:hypothetical protein
MSLRHRSAAPHTARAALAATVRPAGSTAAAGGAPSLRAELGVRGGVHQLVELGRVGELDLRAAGGGARGSARRGAARRGRAARGSARAFAIHPSASADELTIAGSSFSASFTSVTTPETGE